MLFNISLFFLALTFTSWISHAGSHQDFRKNFSIPMACDAQQVLLLDLKTNSILFEKNADVRMHPSSMTKIALLYYLFESIKNNDIALSDMVIVSPHAAKQEGTRMYLKPMQSVKYEDLIKGIAAISGNDACTAVAESLMGSEPLLAEVLNDKVKELGGKNTHFSNASGLPDPNHWSTCWDLARIAIATLKNFPEEYKKYYGIKKFIFNGVIQYNLNGPLKKDQADGMKTGRTNLGKYGIVVSSERKGRRLLLILNGVESDLKRTCESIRLLNWGFQFFDSLCLFKAGAEVLSVPVWEHGEVPIVAQDNIFLSYPRGLRRKIKLTARYYTPLIAPIRKGQKVGVLVVSLPKCPEIEYPLVVGKDVVTEQGMIEWIKKKFSW